MPVLTTPAIRKYRPTAERREIPDSRARGLCLIIQPSGRMSWAVRLRRPDGRSAKLTLGPVDLADKETSDEPVAGAALTLGQARELAAQIDRKRQRGIDVVAEHQAEESRKQTAATDRAANSFGACVREFIIDHKTSPKRGAKRPRRWREDAATLGLRYPLDADPAVTEPEIIPAGLAETWADKAITGIDGHDVHAVVDEARKHGSESRARKLHSALSVMFGWLQRKRRVTVNPVAGVFRPAPPPSRERVLSDAEIVTFWKATDRVGGSAGALFKLLLLTGCRLREASGMTPAELEADGTWVVPGSRTKNHRPLTLPLPQSTLDIIASAPRVGDNYAFTVNGRKPLSNFSGLKHDLDDAMAEVAGKPVVAWRLHDLRRTFASNLAALGVALPVIERLLNHVSGSFAGVAGVYQRYEFKDEKAEALARWAAHLQGLVSGKPDNVAKLPARKRARTAEDVGGPQ
jgi:integrase